MKRLFKKSAILLSTLALSLLPALQTMAVPVENNLGDMSFEVRNALGREGVPIQVEIEASLISDNQIEYRGRQYSTQDFASFLVRNLLIGPYANTVMRVEFCRDLPTHYAPFERITMMAVDGGTTCVVAHNGTTVAVVCESIDTIGVEHMRAHARELFY